MNSFFIGPIKRSHYREEEVNHELISAVKAFSLCKDVAKEFYDCRREVKGTVEPEVCLESAWKVVKCYDYLKKVPVECRHQYDNVKKCLDGQEDCTGLMDKYVKCYSSDLSYEH